MLIIKVSFYIIWFHVVWKCEIRNTRNYLFCRLQQISYYTYYVVLVLIKLFFVSFFDYHFLIINILLDHQSFHLFFLLALTTHYYTYLLRSLINIFATKEDKYRQAKYDSTTIKRFGNRIVLLNDRPKKILRGHVT